MRYEKEQTVVDWFIKELGEYFPWGIGGIEYLIKQAKEMEKLKAFEIFKAGQDSMEEGGKGFEQWYEQKYGGKK